MKIAVFTLTRDRLEYTKKCFASLRKKAGHEYDHFILDNGSTDETKQWLRDNKKDFAKIVYMKHNIGLAPGVNRIMKEIFGKDDYDLVIKFDNDCRVMTNNILQHVVNVFSKKLPYAAEMILSPRVVGILKQPRRVRYFGVGGYKIGLTGHVGGIFQIVPGFLYKKFVYPDTIAKAKGQDSYICGHYQKLGVNIGYIESIVVEHFETMEGQSLKYPEYFKRKKKEENEKTQEHKK